MHKTLLEICCGCVEDAVTAEQGGANRIELCSALFLGGLTPSAGCIIETKARLKIPVMVMVRPRPSGFCYSSTEMDVMLRDSEKAISLGADGIVFGILKRDGSVDEERCRRVRDLIGDRQAVFHRAFDVTPDPFRALDQLIDLGITRVLTSGQQSAASRGTDLLKHLTEYARGRIEILPGGGVRVQTVYGLIQDTGCTQVHLTALAPRCDTSTAVRPDVKLARSLVPPETEYETTDSRLVERIVQEIRRADAAAVIC